MKIRWIVTLLVLTCLGAGAPPAIAENDFTDPNCVGLWLFEDDPGFTVDSSGNGNTLNNNTYPAVKDTVNIKQGSQSAYFYAPELKVQLSCWHSNLSANFPGKIASDFSCGGWMYLKATPSVADGYMLLSKRDSATNHGSYLLWLHNDGGTLKWRLNVCDDSANNSTFALTPTYAPAINRWYHVVGTHQISDYACKLRVYDLTKCGGGGAGIVIDGA